MENMVLQKVWQQGQRLTVDDLSGCAFTGENAAHTFEISGKNASGAVAISGTIAGKFLRSDNVTVPVTGTASDGVASITLTEDCYAVPGRFIFSVYANDGTHNICIYCGVGNVLRTDSGEYEGGEIITDVTALINAIETAVATIPADYSTLLAAIAPTFSASTAYGAGSYVWYDGNLYKFAADHAAGSWTGTDAAAVALANDVAYLKSALNYARNVKYLPTANPKISITDNTLTITFSTESKYLNNGVSLTIPAGTYTVDISGTHMLGVFWNGTSFVTQFYENLVPDNWYLFLITYNQKIDYNSLFSTIEDHIGRISKGVVFMYVSQSTLHFYVPTLDNRCILQGSSFILPRGDMTFDCPNAQAPYYVVVNSATDISLKYYTKIDSADNIVAYVIGQEVFPLSDNIIANKMPLPSQMYSRNNVAFFINRERLGYDIVAGNIIKNDNTMKNYGSTIRLYNYRPTTWRLADRLGDNQFSISFSENTANIANKKILMVGDSITNRGWIQRRLLEYVPSLTFLGTKQTGSGQGVTDYMCEATPGATAKQMIGSDSAINNDFETYVADSLNGVVPDYVIIEFGLNESNASDYVTYVQSLIDGIKDYNSDNNSSIKVYVLMPFERCLTQNMGTGYNFSYVQYTTGKRIILDSASFTDCVLIPTYFIFDDRYDYTHEIGLGYGYGVQIDMVSDFVHPSESVGFLKLADMIYNYLGI